MPRYKHVSGIGKVQFTPEEEKEADEQVIAHEKAQEEYLKVKYKDDRKMAYPSYADQFDTIYHQGIDAWKAKIKAVKDKYPKP